MVTKTVDWVILVNHIDSGVVAQPVPPECSIPFKLFDDDGELYFDGVMSQRLYNSHHILDPLDATEYSYGCTEMRVKNPETKKWEVV